MFLSDKATFNDPSLFLMAMPQLGDPRFFQGVVLLLEHTQNGALGLIINRPLHLYLGSFAATQKMDYHKKWEKEPIYYGGPVQPGQGWILHADPSVNEKIQVLPHTFLSRTVDAMKQVIQQDQSPIRFILGYAGWTAGQLEDEMKQGSWLTFSADAKHVFSLNPEKMWGDLLKEKGVDPLHLVSVSGVH